MSTRAWTRFAIWIPLVLLAIGYRWWQGGDGPSDAPVEAEGGEEAPAPIGWRERRASAAEWQRPIAALGRDRQAKRLVWRGLGPEPVDARGALVWWHDGERERVSYLPVAGEDAMTGVGLASAIEDGSVVLFDLHGDPSLVERIVDIGSTGVLPEGWEVLLPPDPEARQAAE